MRRRVFWSAVVIAMGASVGSACSSSESGGNANGGRGSTDDAGTISRTDAASGGGDVGDAGSQSGADAGTDGDAAPSVLTLTSTAFVEGGAIPVTHALCPDGSGNESPPLAWANPPAGTQSYAVVMRDVDVAAPDNYHWVIWNIPASATSLPQGIAAQASPPTPAGAKQAHWSFSADYSYQGPCPPAKHHYRFAVYTFATPTIPIPGGETDPVDADAIIQANKTASATLTGTYVQ